MDSAMTSTITMDAAGRVVLPAQIRKRLHCKQARSSASTSSPTDSNSPRAEETSGVSRKDGRLVLSATGKSFDAAAAIRAERVKQTRRASRQ